MAQQRTENSRFLSRYAVNTYVTPAQYLTECLCFLIARAEKRELGQYFWRQPYWAKIFRSQIPAANTLLEDYPVDVVLATLRDKRSHRIKSFRQLSILKPLLGEKLAIYKEQQKDMQANAIEDDATLQRPRKPLGRKSIITKLREIG